MIEAFVLEVFVGMAFGYPTGFAFAWDKRIVILLGLAIAIYLVGVVMVVSTGELLASWELWRLIPFGIGYLPAEYAGRKSYETTFGDGK